MRRNFSLQQIFYATTGGHGRGLFAPGKHLIRTRAVGTRCLSHYGSNIGETKRANEDQSSPRISSLPPNMATREAFIIAERCFAMATACAASDCAKPKRISP